MSGTFACHAFDGTSEIQVKYVGVGRFNDDFRGIFDSVGKASVGLDGNWTFIIAHFQFLKSLVDASDKGICSHKFRIDHRGSEASA